MSRIIQKVFSIRAPESEVETWHQAALDSNRSRNNWIRQALNDAADLQKALSKEEQLNIKTKRKGTDLVARARENQRKSIYPNYPSVRVRSEAEYPHFHPDPK